jgi:hypothetical protein
MTPASRRSGRIRGARLQGWGEASQAAKRTLQRLGIGLPPLRAVLDVTDRCNLRCPTCSKWRSSPARPELGQEAWELILSKLAGVLLFRELVVSGGEPFTRDDIFDILATAKRHNFKVLVISNGWLLSEAVLQRLEDIGVDGLTVSLNSLSADVHDRSRGALGSHERIMRFVQTWQGWPRRTGLSLATVIMEPNVGELERLASFAWEGHFGGIAFQVLAPPQAHYPFADDPCMPPQDSGWPVGDPLWVRDLGTLGGQVQRLLQMQAQGCPVVNPPVQLRRMVDYYAHPETVCAWPCLGTQSRIYVDPYGDVRLCYGFPPLGNLLRDDPRALWRSQGAASIRRASRSCDRLCRMLNNNL